MPIVVPLVALDVLVIVLWTIAVALAIAVIVKFIGKVFSGVPVVGGYIAGAMEAVGRTITNACGYLIKNAEQLVGGAFHALARYMDHLWEHLVWSSHFMVQAAADLLRLTHAQAGLRSLVHRAVGTAEAVLPRVKTIEKEYHGIEHQVKRLERDLTKGIGHDLRIQVHGLEKELTTVETQVIPSIRSIADTAEGDVTALRKWIASHVPLIGTSALSAAVAWALGSIGLGGLRCNSLLNSLKNRGCGLWSGLEDLLGLFIDAVLLTHLCDLPKWIEELFSPLLGELTGLISSAANSLCAAANPKWAKLDVQNGPLPPPQTLYLPDHFG